MGLTRKRARYLFWLFVWRRTLRIRLSLVHLGSQLIELGDQTEYQARNHMTYARRKLAVEQLENGDKSDG